jgi:perosamine synthetase
VEKIINMKNKIPWAKPTLFGLEKKYIIKALSSSWISAGPFVLKLENLFKKKFNTKYAFAVSNGTSALHLAFLASGLKPGDEIVVPGFGYMAAANIAKLMNLKIIFSDVNKNTFCLDLENLKKVISKKTKAVVTINTYGNVHDLDKIKKYLSKKKILFVEDAAESLGSKLKNKLSGTFGDMGTFSFHATKNIVTGEGGMVITNNAKLAKNISLYRSHGVLKERYNHQVHGHNFRLTNLQAAVGVAQFQNLNKIIYKRKKIYKWYISLINKNKLLLQRINNNSNVVPWTIAIFLKKSMIASREKIMKNLLKANIETRNGFYSADRLKIFKTNKKLLNSNSLSKNIICLPFYYDMTKKDVNEICSKLNELI